MPLFIRLSTASEPDSNPECILSSPAAFSSANSSALMRERFSARAVGRYPLYARERLPQIYQHVRKPAAAQCGGIAVLQEHILAAVDEPVRHHVKALPFITFAHHYLSVETVYIPSAAAVTVSARSLRIQHHGVYVPPDAVCAVGFEFRMPVYPAEPAFVPCAPISHLQQQARRFAGRSYGTLLKVPVCSPVGSIVSPRFLLYVIDIFPTHIYPPCHPGHGTVSKHPVTISGATDRERMCINRAMTPVPAASRHKTRSLRRRRIGAAFSFAAVMSHVFIITFGPPPGTFLTRSMENLTAACTEYLRARMISAGMNPPFISLVTDGVCTGTGSVLSFVPAISLLFLQLSILEHSRFMDIAAFALDGVMKKAGLPELPQCLC